MAWRAAKITGHFQRPTDEAAATNLVRLLSRRDGLVREARHLDRAVGKATQMRRRVELTLELRMIDERLTMNRAELAG